MRKVSEPIEKIDDQILALIDEMFITLKRQNGIGLAAPQIGRNIQLFIVQLSEEEKYVFINPQIIFTSQTTCVMEEGCLSIPGIYESVERFETIKVQYLNQNGRRKVLEASGLLARVIQHENDHLKGVLFIDRLDEEKKNAALKKAARKRLFGFKKKK